MIDMNSISLCYQNNQLTILDQTQLPRHEVWVEASSLDIAYAIIKMLKVRGAPLIGVFAAVYLAHITEQGASLDSIYQSAQHLLSARPTAVNLAHCIERFLAVLDRNESQRAAAIACSEAIFAEDVELCQNMAKHGQAFIQDNTNLMTYCNTGGLATVGIGTALGVLRLAHEQGKNIHVYVNETRPLLQGGRLTTWELEQAGIPHTLICDNMAAQLMAQGKVDGIFLGSDRIAHNGDFANKIGTYNHAVLANYHKVPFYVVAPYTTVDMDCPDGAAIEIEQRNAKEVLGVSSGQIDIAWAKETTNTYNPAFDVTPGNLVTRFVLDSGVYRANEISEIQIPKHTLSTA